MSKDTQPWRPVGAATPIEERDDGPLAGVLPRRAALQRRLIQRKAAQQTEPSTRVTSAPVGDVPYRSEMEQAFEQDFSTVRATTGRSEETHAIGAQAMTSGEDVMFADANPSRELVAHELTHVVQQRAGKVRGAQGAGAAVDPDPALEVEAETVGHQVGRGERAEVASAGDRGPLAPSDATAAILRKPDVSKAIDWTSAKQVKRLGDHPVWRIELPDGAVVIKAQAGATSAKEVFAGKLAGAMLPGSDAAEMRLLGSDEKALFQKIILQVDGADGELESKVVANTDLLVMDYMDGTDLNEGQELITPKGKDRPDKEGLERIQNVGELLSFNFLIQGADRFNVPVKDYGGGERNDNIRLANNSTQVQAVDNTVRDGLKYALEDPQKAAADFQRAITPLIDNLILDPSGDSVLARNLENQLHVGDTGPEGRDAIRQGFGRGMDAIGNSPADLGKLLAESAPPDVLARCQLLAAGDGRGYLVFLEAMQTFFRIKAAQFRAVNDAYTKGDRSSVLGVLREASRVALGEPIVDLALLKSLDRDPSKETGGTKGKKARSKQWPPALRQIETDRDRKFAKLTSDERQQVIDNIITTGQTVLVQDDAGIWEDFARMSAKVIVKMMAAGR